MKETYIKLEGKLPGVTSLVLVGVHGDERCGVEAIQRLLPDLVIENGTVLIEYGNPLAIEQNVRFTEANLNRMFKPDVQLMEQEKKSYEYERAQYLKTLLQKADVLLDIHASFTPKSKPFLICEPSAYAIAAQLPFDTVVSGFDDVEPGGTDYYANSLGKLGISVECGYLGDQTSTEKAVETIRRFFAIRGHIIMSENIDSSVSQKRFRMYKLYLTKTNNFQLTRDFADFETVPQGGLIGIDGAEPIIAEKQSIILFARNRQSIGEEAFLLGTEEATEF